VSLQYSPNFLTKASFPKSIQQVSQWHCNKNNTHNRFTALFLDHLGEPVPEEKKKSSGLLCAREDNRGRHTNHRVGATASGLINNPPSSPHFYARCPSCRNPPTLSWLGTGTKYASLHTQWRGS